MEKKDIFQDIQNIRSSNPVIVLGSGASVSYGIPGMGVLANELKNFFKSNPYYDTATNDVVSDFIKLWKLHCWMLRFLKLLKQI